TERERCVERLLCELLASHPALIPQSLPQAADPAASLQWARTHAATLSSLTGRYRGLPPVALWGRMQPLPAAMSPARRTATDEVEPHPEAQRVASMRRRPLVRQHADDEDDSHMGLSMIQLDDPQEHVEDPLGLQRPTDRDYEADPEDLADSLSELPEARLVTAPGRPTELLTTDDPPPRRPLLPGEFEQPTGYAYPEWDFRLSAYHPARAVVRELPVQRGDPRWVKGVLLRHASAVEQIRRRFERLRPQ